MVATVAPTRAADGQIARGKPLQLSLYASGHKKIQSGIIISIDNAPQIFISAADFSAIRT